MLYGVDNVWSTAAAAVWLQKNLYIFFACFIHSFCHVLLGHSAKRYKDSKGILVWLMWVNSVTHNGLNPVSEAWAYQMYYILWYQSSKDQLCLWTSTVYKWRSCHLWAAAQLCKISEFTQFVHFKSLKNDQQSEIQSEDPLWPQIHNTRL